MNSRYGDRSYDNPAFRDGYQTQSQLLREQDDELELVSGNGETRIFYYTQHMLDFIFRS